MTQPRSVAVIGLGLIGGSLARELAGRGVHVAAYDTDAGVLAEGIREGVVHTAVDDSLAGTASADLIVIATPVDAALDVLSRLAPHLAADAVVTDVGSTKEAISIHAGTLGIGPRFVGSHPLAGDHRSGWCASRSGLYMGIRVFVCPTPSSSPAAVEAVQAFWTALGASSRLLQPAEHDRRMAWVSHLPQITSSALARVLGLSHHSPADLGPGGRDMTRLAGSSPEMWSAICRANANHLEGAVEELVAGLTRFQSALRRRDPEAIETFFREARDWM